jgi:hypothetical protein
MRMSRVICLLALLSIAGCGEETASQPRSALPPDDRLICTNNGVETVNAELADADQWHMAWPVNVPLTGFWAAATFVPPVPSPSVPEVVWVLTLSEDGQGTAAFIVDPRTCSGIDPVEVP